MTFQRLLDFARKYLEVIESRDEGYAYTQLVIGEMHFLPRVQCELLKNKYPHSIFKIGSNVIY